MENIADVRETPELMLKYVTAKHVNTFVNAYGKTTDHEEAWSIVAGIGDPEKGTRDVAALELMLREDLDEEELVYVFANPDYLFSAFEEGHIGVKPTTIDALERVRHCSIVKVIITAYSAADRLHDAGIDLSEESTLSDISTAAFCHLATKYLANGDQGW